MLTKLSQNRIVRFLICGGVAAAFNILLLAIIIESFNLDQPVLRNIANVVSIEVSLLFSFFVYRTWVWSKSAWKLKEVLWREIPLYHLSCGSVVAMRSLILFPVLDWLGVNYSINSLVGIVIGSAMNYVMSDQLVFKSK
ncbi:GtrA family protein [Microseira wollei]|uniref:Glycosyl transferase family 2 n=1 Tax=Microseira wollei NIES-4236 TaxID=2530354 RepID=A0AAV3X0I4_9CYAN|nr:GtrA family protein [Microseira wollei]GET35663.1 glycosyl transferase family 2 [Microseira wollei NIES-4236]